VEASKLASQQMLIFTEVDPVIGDRFFIKGNNGFPDYDAFSSARYGAALMKLGWKVQEWNDDYFGVIDAAQRVGLCLAERNCPLAGRDGRICRDIMYEPPAPVHCVLSNDELAWYHVLLANPVARVAEAQRPTWIPLQVGSCWMTTVPPSHFTCASTHRGRIVVVGGSTWQCRWMIVTSIQLMVTSMQLQRTAGPIVGRLFSDGRSSVLPSSTTVPLSSTEILNAFKAMPDDGSM
jgi:hypothetical protein